MGVVGDNWFDCVFALDSLHVQTLTLTDAQTPFLRTPILPLSMSLAVELRVALRAEEARAEKQDIYIYIYIYRERER